MTKRQREADEQTAQALLNDARLAWGQTFQDFSMLPRDVQVLIAKMTPGTLMNLAQARPTEILRDGRRVPSVFVIAAREDNTWREFFQRDYPHDWEFCRGTLPFYVLDTTHPFYSENQILERDASPWKRFYFHTARLYRLSVKMFIKVYGAFLNNAGITVLTYRNATQNEIYLWFHRVIAKVHLEEWDYRAALASSFLEVLFSFIFPNGFLWDDVDQLLELTNTTNLKWIWLYIQHAHPLSYKPEGNDHKDVFHDDYQHSVNELIVNTDIQMDDENLREDWQRYNTENPNWRNGRQDLLFSNQDRENLVTFLNNTENVLFSEEEFSERVAYVLKYWDLLVDRFRMPCISTIHMTPYDDALDIYKFEKYHISYISSHTSERFVYMRRESAKVREYARMLSVGIFPRINFKNSDFQQLTFTSEELQNRFNRFALMTSNLERYDPFYNRSIREMFLQYLSVPRWDGAILHLEKPICVTCWIQSAMLFKCGGKCQDPKVIYCGEECQAADWHVGGHKDRCNNKK